MAHKGKFKPKNWRKYDGNSCNIIYRSMWECSYMMRLDADPKVLSWSSESVCIPYTDKATGNFHRYFPDFKVTRKESDGSVRTYIIEIKPRAQVLEPKKGTKSRNKFLKEVMTYGKNLGKWESAERYCEKKGYKFQILTEKELGQF